LIPKQNPAKSSQDFAGFVFKPLDPKTTGIYTHLAHKNNQRLASPLEWLDLLIFYCVNTADWGWIDAMGWFFEGRGGYICCCKCAF
jgi:hypothetical protein